MDRNILSQKIRAYNGRPIQTIEDRFWSYVDLSGHCWIWTGGIRNGYGQFRVNGKKVSAHRFSWLLRFGEIPEIAGTDYRGTCVLHHCDVPLCVRPGHLFLGSNADNMADMVAKGRGPDMKGDRGHNSKLTTQDVIFIRESSQTQERLAEIFSVHQTTVSLIKCRKSWVHI